IIFMKKIQIFFLLIISITSHAQSWKLTGNKNTVPSLNFVGTKDAVVLQFRVNNQKSGLIDYNSASANTAFGYQSLSSVTTGKYNSAFGYNALSNNISGSYNTATGQGALQYNTSGNYNTATGLFSLALNTTGLENTATGANALESNTTGSYNIAGGRYALRLNTTGNNNTALGYLALYSNTTGYSNVALGSGALYLNSIASNIVAIGDSALYNNASVSTLQSISNTAIGSKALFFNSTGYKNTATGYQTLYSNTSGFGNTANGHQALYSNTTAVYNTANGYAALYSNTTGSSNTANGYNTLYSNTLGHSNSANGGEALRYNTTGSSNTANGYAALKNNRTGDSNTANGYKALYTNNKGKFNTADGVEAGSFNDNNTYCTFLGFDADQSINYDFTNSTALGNGSRITTSHLVTIGNTAIQAIRGQVDFTTISDGRFKKNIKENVPGLQFINKLKPVTYNLDVTGVSRFLKEDNKNNALNEEQNYRQSSMQKEREKKEKILYTGFVAQDVEKVAKELNYDFSGVDAAKNENDLYGLRYGAFVVPLVKAVQELSKENDAKDEVIIDLKKRLEKLEAFVTEQSSTFNTKQQTLNISSASLEQNTPNPFGNSTVINYTLPQKFIAAQIIITDQHGKVMQQANLKAPGKGNINVNVQTLSSGVYNYSLFVDSKLIETKKMVLQK
ncbi:MAG: tail fiber domain-containing protein, partial [Parafilimonas sp.]